MHPGVVIGQFGPSQALPKVDVLLSLCIWWCSGKHPCVRPLTISAHYNICVQAKPKQKVAKQNSMIFRVSTALNTQSQLLEHTGILTLERNDCIECQTSTFSAPGASILWKGIKLTNLAAWSGDSSSLSAIIGLMSEHTGL